MKKIVDSEEMLAAIRETSIPLVICEGKKASGENNSKKISFKIFGGLGDEVTFCGCLNDLISQNGNIQVEVQSGRPFIYGNLPLYIFNEDDPAVEHFKIIGYPPKDNDRGFSLRYYFTNHIQNQTGISFAMTTTRAPLPVVFNVENPIRQKLQYAGDYWLVNAGYIRGNGLKYWGRENFQVVIDALKGRIAFVQVGSLKCGAFHKSLDGVLDLIGMTSDAELLRMVRESSGVLCGVTGIAHAAGCYSRPGVVIVGGRESPALCRYPGLRIFDSLGLLNCCRSFPCEKWRINECSTFDCMKIIRPEDVIREIFLIEGMKL
jgi:hypothetical protein